MGSRRIKEYIRNTGIEPFVWLFALLYLWFSFPISSDDISICPLYHLGIQGCPGCGLGKSVSYALNGEFENSLKVHLLGIPAAIILFYRIFTLLLNPIKLRRTGILTTTQKEL